MKKEIKLNLQFFAEGTGAGAGTGTGSEGSGTGAETAVSGVAGPKESKNPLENVVYGKQTDIVEEEQVQTATTPEEKAKKFEELIRGEYKDEFQDRTQKIINGRFKDVKETKERLEAQDALIRAVAEKYKVDPSDYNALSKAIEADDAFLQQEASEQGLSVEQLKRIRSLERENAHFKRDAELAAQRENGERIYAKWIADGEQMAQKYGLANFDIETEIQNPDFSSLLSAGVGVEAAYKAIHMDEMLSGAMAQTAAEVKKGIVNNIAARSGRPSENGISPQATANFKTDVNALTKEDRAEIMRRVQRGETITF